MFSDTALVAIVGVLGSVLTVFLSNRHALKLKILELGTTEQSKKQEHDYQTLENFLSCFGRLSLLEFRTYDGEWAMLSLTDEDKIKLLSEYKSSLGALLSLISNELSEKIRLADSRIDSAEVQGGIIDMNLLLPEIRKEIENQNLKIN